MSATELTKQSVRTLLPLRPADGHKGNFGHLFVIAGSQGFTGAAKLAGLAAARSGAGLVTLGVPKSQANIVAAGALELMTLALPSSLAGSFSSEALRSALLFAQDKSAVSIGPGLSQNGGTQRFVRAFIARCAPAMVIDADALNALAGHAALLKNAASCCVLTPHPGEMARLCACSTAEVQKDREGVATRFAQKHGCVVVLKGHRTVVAGPEGEVFVNPTGNSGMATGGTGDVLTGMIGGLLAQGLRPLDAARLGVYAHGLAGDLTAAEKTERGMIAGDVIENLPAAWRYLEGAFAP